MVRLKALLRSTNPVQLVQNELVHRVVVFCRATGCADNVHLVAQRAQGPAEGVDLFIEVSLIQHEVGFRHRREMFLNAVPTGALVRKGTVPEDFPQNTVDIRSVDENKSARIHWIPPVHTFTTDYGQRHTPQFPTILQYRPPAYAEG